MPSLTTVSSTIQICSGPMKSTSNCRRFPLWRIFAAAAAFFGLAPLEAAPVAVNNASFESANYSGANSWTNDLTDNNPATTIEWQGRDGNANGNCFIERIGGFFSQGVAHVGMAVGYFIYQDTEVAWLPNTRYTLTVGVGMRNAGFSTATNLTAIGLTNTIPVGGTATDVITNDPLLTMANATKNVSTQPLSSFADLSVNFETGATAPTGTIFVFLGDQSGTGRSHFDNVRLDAVSSLDPDADGLPSDWETANGLNPNSNTGVNGAAGDPDNDGSPNSQEFARITNPQNADTDGDGAKDGAETKTGIYVSLTDLGTDPLVADTDGDTLPDGSEPLANPHVTDPNKADTDGDQFEDQAEIAAGTNPAVGGQGSFPTSAGDLILGLNFVGGRVDGTLGGTVTAAAGVVPQTNWNNLLDLSGKGAALLNAAGTGVIMRAEWTVDDTYTVLTGGPPADANAALMQGMLRTRKGVPTQVIVRNISAPTYDVYVYADSDGTDRVANYTVNGQTLSGILDDANWPVDTGGGIFQLAAANGAAGNYLLFRNVTGPTMTLTVVNTTAANDFGGPVNAIQIVRATGDTDGDGMPDIWEDANGLNKNVNDAAADADADGATNLQEFQRNTNPQDSDSDDDGLKDGVETKTGLYLNAANTGTDPLKPDTDADGLTDALENNSGSFVDAANPGTDPNKADTDGDGFGDSEEIAASTSPVSAASKPLLPTPAGYWSFDDQGLATTADLSPGGNPGNLQGGTAYVAGHTGAAGDFAIQFNGVDAAVTTGVPLLDGLEQFSMAGWLNFTAAQANRTGIFGQNDVVEFAFSSAPTIELWNPTGGAISTASAPAGGGTWKHIAVTADSTGRRIYIGGVLVASGSVGTPTAVTGGSFNIGGAGIADAANNWFNGSIDDVAVWNQSLSATFISQLASRTLTPLPSTGEFGISSFNFNQTTRVFTLSYNTTAGVQYTVQMMDPAHPTLNNTWQNVTTVTATGALTTYAEVMPPGAPVRLFRIKRL